MVRRPSGGWVVYDLDSSSGLLVQGRRVAKRVLGDLDLVQLGVGVDLVFRLGSRRPTLESEAETWKLRPKSIVRIQPGLLAAELVTAARLMASPAWKRGVAPGHDDAEQSQVIALDPASDEHLRALADADTVHGQVIGPCLGAMGPYRLLEPLGEGGMAVVYRATRGPDGPEVALKVLKNTGHPNVRRRFLREARVMARLEHPGIIAVHEVATDRDTPYIAMPLLRGGSLQDRLDRDGPLSVNEAARILASVADAAQAAHDADVLHRDIKPANVLLSQDGEAILTDFGLCRDEGPSRSRHGDEDAGDTGTLTMRGASMGTLGYLAPEQLQCGVGGWPDGTTDVFGLGATLYAALTGRPPFGCDTVDAVVRRTRNGEMVPASNLREDLDDRLDAVCARALAMERADRYATPAALAAALRAVLNGEAPHAREETREVRPRPAAPTPTPTPSHDHEPASPSKQAEVLAWLEAPDSSEPDREQRARALRRLGDAKYERGDLESALAALQAALVLEPDRVTVLLRCAVIHRQREELQRAVELYDRVLNLDPFEHRAHVGRAVANERLGDVFGALLDYERARDLMKPGPKRARVERAIRRLRGRSSAA
jgi:serine/threonine protein kinase